MLERFLITYSAPTLAGIKTGSLFCCGYSDAPAVRREAYELNRRLWDKGLRLRILRFSEKRVLIYVFRPARLRCDLAQDAAIPLLKHFGYDGSDVEGCLLRLKQRIAESEEFPHEIGLFLGYPPRDVLGFIENGGKNYILAGCWKVYGDAEEARSYFDRCRNCTEACRRAFSRGLSVEQLTAAC